MVLAVLGAALPHASWNALVKASDDKVLDMHAIAMGAGLIGIVVAPWLPVPARTAWPWLVALAVVQIPLNFRFLAGVCRWGDLSFSYRIMRGGAPARVALLGGFAFDGFLSWPQVAGVALVCAGVLALAAQPTRKERNAVPAARARAR